jgi:sulfonate transport system substrate-binding protein
MGTAAALTACENKGGAARTASALPQTVTIASISYPYQGKQTYNGLTQVVIEQGWLEKTLADKGVKLAFFPVSTAVGGPLINESFAAKRIDFAGYGDFL